MADLSIGEVGKVLQLNLVNVDTTQNPPVSSPLDLSGASSVTLSWLITAANAAPPATPTVTGKVMSIQSPATAGIVTYTFIAGDLVAPNNMGKYGVFRYSVTVNFTGGGVILAALDGSLTIKNDAVL